MSTMITESADDPTAFDITVTAGQFEGIVYRLGDVSFPDEDEPILQFSYDIIDGELSESDKPVFEKFVGDSIVQMLEEQLRKGELVYHGGT